MPEPLRVPPKPAPAKLAMVPAKPAYDWERARACLSATAPQGPKERSPAAEAQDRRAATELRHLARRIPSLERDEVVAALRKLADDFEGEG